MNEVTKIMSGKKNFKMQRSQIKFCYILYYPDLLKYYFSLNSLFWTVKDNFYA